MTVYLFTVKDPLYQEVRLIDPAHLWVNYNFNADSLTIYFTDKPVPSVWEDIDDYVYIGFASDDETIVTGVMIEHFSKWLLALGYSEQERELV